MSEPAHILVIDDDERLRELLRRFLEESGFRVTGANSAAEARDYMKAMHFDLLVIDVMMPGETGVEFLASIRPAANIPALFLTALSETENRIEGLEAGADDYIAKPFEPRELILRISRILDRQIDVSSSSDIQFGPFSLNLDSNILTENGRRIHITTAEQDLLSCFSQSANQIVSRDEIAQLLDGRMQGRSIDVAVARLRTKLEVDPRYPVMLQTVRGKGWMLKTN